jgi:hypothetical protein
VKLYHLTSCEYGLLALKNQRLKIARIDQLNDPFELLATGLSNKSHRKKLLQFKNWVAEQYGVLCFSRSWKNPVLWSHYGDRHSGVALEFEVHDDDVNEVTYSPNRTLLDVDGAISRGSFSQQDALSLATTKFEHWQYEDEVRVFCSLKDSINEGQLFFQEFSERLKLTSVVKGAMCKLTEKQISQNLPAGSEIHVVKSRLAFKTFTIVPNLRVNPKVVQSSTQQQLQPDVFSSARLLQKLRLS